MKKDEASPLLDIIHAYSNLASAVANQLDGRRLAHDLDQIRQVTEQTNNTGKLYNEMTASAIAQLLAIHGEAQPKRH